MEMSSLGNDQNRMGTSPRGALRERCAVCSQEASQACSLSDGQGSEFLSCHSYLCDFRHDLPSLSLSFLLHKMGIIVPSPWNCEK